MAWIYLVFAGLLEIAWAFALKASDGFSRLGWSIFTLVAMAASFWLLALAMRSLPLGTAYAIWTGIGALGAFIVGIVVLGEAVSLMRIGSAALILAGLVGLKLSSGE
ncbi:quaternary ammonium compound efflux SMR transporter SugE [Roseomonas xinghualingensis]|uniref:quaternary ammonium compound efflux SMR transporter SugE n=1 Tax=Roseomonas xinghualingensis TaxID=2986475 RepID=UPI0021F1F82A|nr:quaternary ammonium compound efflux SMR transporter SugE [Roseomonas sp. SXEYE001]MCV4206982.1 quaternary ammonium compound efflux SMR transporter SugE [Roseomonas sp. SXEYE001]